MAIRVLVASIPGLCARVALLICGAREAPAAGGMTGLLEPRLIRHPFQGQLLLFLAAVTPGFNWLNLC